MNRKFPKLSALNKIVLAALLSISTVFVLQNYLIGQMMALNSRQTAARIYETRMTSLANSIAGSSNTDSLAERIFFSMENEDWNILLLSPELKIIYGPDQNLYDNDIRDCGSELTDRDRIKYLEFIQSAFEHGSIYSQMEIVSPFSGEMSYMFFQPVKVISERGETDHYLYIDAPLQTITAEASQNRLMALPILALQYLIALIIITGVGRLVQFIKKKQVELNTKELQLITEEAKTARAIAEDAVEAKAKFLANMSHEIRTPMNAIMGMSELLLSEELNSGQYRWVQNIHVSAAALLNIINDILDYSKIEAGKFDLSPVHYDFNIFIDNIGSMVQFMIKNKNLDFKLHLEGELPGCLYGDDVRLRQVLLNILGNAIKFTNEGSVSLTIRADESPDCGPRLHFAISDTGIGIPEEDVPRLFDAFTQVDMLKNRNQEGTGLGLSITSSLLKMMKGEITLESIYGEGTTFFVTIPMIPGDEALIHQDTGNVISLYAPEAKILVVDDNTINLNVATGLLGLHKIEAQTAKSGPEAIKMLGENNFDLVFMDHMMPGMDGVETTKIIREMGKTLPIIALTANAIAGAREEYIAAGMNDLLTKPVKRSLLSQILKDWLPPEKIVMTSVETPAAEITPSKTDFWQKIGEIKDLSLQTGLDRVAGQREVYEKSLRLAVKEIYKCEENLDKFLTAHDMRNFSIEAHSMKGSLANIGATDLYILAQDLESAAEKGDSEFCREKLPSFLEKLIILRLSLEEAFAADTEAQTPSEIPPELPASLTKILDKLKTAINETDFLTISEGIKSLNKLNLEGVLKNETEKIKDAVLMMDYESALKIITEIT